MDFFLFANLALKLENEIKESSHKQNTMNLVKQLPKKGILLMIVITIGICLFVSMLLYAPDYARFVKMNSINSIIIATFLLFILSFGIILGRTKESTKTIAEFETNLTDREKEIVLLIIQQKKNIEIANTLFVELSTIKSHINNIYKKENVNNRKEIIQKYHAIHKNTLQ